MGMFDFGQSPTSDQCEEVVIECKYDEVPADSTPLPRWFEIAAGETLFDLINEPVDYEDMVNREFSESEVTNVGPAENGGDEEGVLPVNIAMTMAYFQEDKDHKSLILVEFDFAELEEVSED